MKPAVLAIIIALALAATPAAAQKVYVDYDTYADMSSYETFAWVDTNTTSLKMDYPEVDSLIKNNIEYYLVKGGMAEDTKDPDVYVTYHASTQHQTQFMTATYGYGYGTGWAWGPYWGPRMVSGTMATEFERGTMIVDIWDAREKMALFRGTVTKIHADDPMKAIKQIDKGIDKIVKKYREMRAKEARK
jgi:hypothetical protein